MKRIFTLLLLGTLCSNLSLAAPCESRTGRTAHVIVPEGLAPDVDSIRVYTPSGDCIGEAAPGPEAFPITLWGYDPISNLYLAKDGIRPDETPRFAALDNGLEYNVSLGFNETYEEDAILIASAFEPILLDTARVEFTTAEIEAISDPWQATINMSSPVNVGAVILELRVSGGLAITSVEPAADTYVVGDTTAVLIGAAGLNTVFTVTGTGTGSVSISRIRGTDRAGNLLFFLTSGAQTLSVGRPIIADVNGDGVLNADDLHLVFVALVENDEAAVGEADIFPWPNGDSVVDLLDLYYLNTAVITGRWPDGTSVD